MNLDKFLTPQRHTVQ